MDGGESSREEAGQWRDTHGQFAVLHRLNCHQQQNCHSTSHSDYSLLTLSLLGQDTAASQLTQCIGTVYRAHYYDINQ